MDLNETLRKYSLRKWRCWKAFQGQRSKVKVRQRQPCKCGELDSSWTAEGIWTKIYQNTYYSRETNWLPYVFKVMVSEVKVTETWKRTDRRFTVKTILLVMQATKTNSRIVLCVVALQRARSKWHWTSNSTTRQWDVTGRRWSSQSGDSWSPRCPRRTSHEEAVSHFTRQLARLLLATSLVTDRLGAARLRRPWLVDDRGRRGRRRTVDVPQWQQHSGTTAVSQTKEPRQPSKDSEGSATPQYDNTRHQTRRQVP